METLKELNEKAWYRFLKVVYILLLILVIAVTSFIILGDNNGFKTVDNEKTEIKCNVLKEKGKEKVFTASEYGIKFSNSHFKDGKLDYPYLIQWSDYIVKDILKVCKREDLLNDDVITMQRGFEIYQNKSLSEQEMNKRWKEDSMKIQNAISSFDKIKYLDFSFKMFDVVPQFTYLYVIKLLVISILVILLIFEIIRRAFYYIVLGKVFPVKN